MSVDLKYLFISSELTTRLMAKGFNESCVATWFADDTNVIYYGHPHNLRDIPAPVYQQVVDWFRIKHGLIIAYDMCEMKCTYNPAEKYHKFSLFKVINCNSVNALSYSAEHTCHDEYYKAFIFTIEEALKLI